MSHDIHLILSHQDLALLEAMAAEFGRPTILPVPNGAHNMDYEPTRDLRDALRWVPDAEVLTAGAEDGHANAGNPVVTEHW